MIDLMIKGQSVIKQNMEVLSHISVQEGPRIDLLMNNLKNKTPPSKIPNKAKMI